MGGGGEGKEGKMKTWNEDEKDGRMGKGEEK